MKVNFLIETTGYDAFIKLDIERVKQYIEGVLSVVRPRETVWVGIDEGRSCWVNKNRLNLLKKQGYKHIFQIRVDGDTYTVAEVEECQENEAPHHQCPCCVMLRVDHAELSQLIRSGQISTGRAI